MEKAKQQKKPLLSLIGGSRTGETKATHYYDYSLVAVIILLTCFGLIMLYSTSSYLAEVQQGDDMFYFRKQALISGASIIGALVISRIDYHILTRFITLLYGMAIVLMMLVKTPLGITANGARRWLGVGESLSFQPSEIAKIAVIVCLPNCTRLARSTVAAHGKNLSASRCLPFAARCSLP